MIYKRNIIKYLIEWKLSNERSPGSRKPLIVRGARQVGKTVAIEDFGKSEFDSFVSLNLEKSEDAELFQKVRSAKEALSLIELRTNKKIIPGKTLLFIDEIQSSESALQQLRYFYEELPALHVVAAGSLLEVLLHKTKLSMPVGRVEYCYMHPFTLDEYLQATRQEIALDQIKKMTRSSVVDPSAHAMLMSFFLTYLTIGGMPEVIAQHVVSPGILALDRIYEALFTSYRNDIGKYASPSQAVYLRHCLDNAPRSVGMQIAYNHFGNSSYRSREIGQAFETLEFALLLSRVWSSRSIALPLVSNRAKAPKLVFLDVGLVNYKIGQRENILMFSQLENVFQGQLSEQIVGQTIRALGVAREQNLNYWYRDKRGSMAEVDYILDFGNSVIPVEVKAGSSQRLQSLHSFVDESGCKLALRVSSRPLEREELKTKRGTKFTLISLPYYLLHRVEEFV